MPNLTRAELLFDIAALFYVISSIANWFLGFERAALFEGLRVPSIIGWMNFAAIKQDGR